MDTQTNSVVLNNALHHILLKITNIFFYLDYEKNYDNRIFETVKTSNNTF